MRILTKASLALPVTCILTRESGVFRQSIFEPKGVTTGEDKINTKYKEEPFDS